MESDRLSAFGCVFFFLRFSAGLTKLNLRENSIGDEGAVAIADALRVNGVLTDLNLSGNNIGGGNDWIKASEVEG